MLPADRASDPPVGSVDDRLHSSIGDIPPIEFEAIHAPNPADLSVAAIASRAADGLTASRVATVGVGFAAHISIASEHALVAQNGSAQAATTAVKRRKAAAWPLRPAG
jgi:hypothetical protein